MLLALSRQRGQGLQALGVDPVMTLDDAVEDDHDYQEDQEPDEESRA